SIAFGADFVTKRSYLLSHRNATYRIEAILKTITQLLILDGWMRHPRLRSWYPHLPVKLPHIKQRNLWHSYDSMIRSCKQLASSQTMLDSIRKGECDETSRPTTLMYEGRQTKMETTL